MTMQGHNDNDNNKAQQTGRTMITDAVKPCLKITINLHSRQVVAERESTQQQMVDNDDNCHDKQQPNNQTVQGRGRRKTMVAKGG